MNSQKENADSKKENRKKFYAVIIADLALFGFFAYLICIIIDYRVNHNESEIFALVVLIIAFIIFSYVFMKTINRELRKIRYTRTNIYLFRKFIFLYEALIIVSLTFLLGINSSLLSLSEIESKVLDFSINACLIIASCIATSTKAALEYTYTTWDFEHHANGDEPINDKTGETGL